MLDKLLEEIAGNPTEINKVLKELIDFANSQIGVLDVKDAVDLAAFLNRRKAHLELVSNDAKSAVADDLNDGEELHGNQWLIRCTLVQPNIFNLKRFKVSQPDVYNAFCEPSPRYTRTFGAV